MFVARILYPVEVLGPGKRIGIWFCGCPHKCKGCSNPELWSLNDRYKTTPETVFNIVSKIAKENQVDGFTISGGDPFYQKEELKIFLEMIKNINDDILIFTGYEISDFDNEDLKNIAVLIDGKYIEELNNNCALRGSSNQRIHILSEKHKEKYDEYLKTAKNKIQNFTVSDGIISVGIHKKGFEF